MTLTLVVATRSKPLGASGDSNGRFVHRVANVFVYFRGGGRWGRATLRAKWACGATGSRVLLFDEPMAGDELCPRCFAERRVVA